MSAPDPTDTVDYSLKRRGFGLAFWASILFCGLCVLAGLAVFRFGPVWFPLKAPPPGSPAQSSAIPLHSLASPPRAAR